MRRRGRALRRRYGRAWSSRTVPDRADLIAALGLPAEGSKRGDKYAATTKEFWNKVRHGTSELSREARRKLGMGEPPT
jgi:hypothetical protein